MIMEAPGSFQRRPAFYFTILTLLQEFVLVFCFRRQMNSAFAVLS